jgi:hypothetical protein
MKVNKNKFRLSKKLFKQYAHLSAIIVKFGFGVYHEQAKQIDKWLKNINFELSNNLMNCIYMVTTPVTTSILNSSRYTANIKQSIGTFEEFLPLTINSRDTVLSISRERARST